MKHGVCKNIGTCMHTTIECKHVDNSITTQQGRHINTAQHVAYSGITEWHCLVRGSGWTVSVREMTVSNDTQTAVCATTLKRAQLATWKKNSGSIDEYMNANEHL